MKRKSRIHEKLNPAPTITFAGDPIDRVLNGFFTDELRKQLPKLDQEIKKEALPVLVAKEEPLRVVFYENHCRCGSKQLVFGYFCRKVHEKTEMGQVSRYKIVEPNGKPQELLKQQQIVPYCSECIPNGINFVKE